MMDILLVVATVFAMILVGYIAVKVNLFSPDEVKVFGKYALNIALPTVVFYTIARRSITE